MPKGRLSVGDDTPTGEPLNGPEGPYITDGHDDAVAAAREAGKHPGQATARKAGLRRKKTGRRNRDGD